MIMDAASTTTTTDGDRRTDLQRQTHDSDETIYICGFNAHGQLNEDIKEDIFTFQKNVYQNHGRSIEVFFAGWSETICTSICNFYIYINPLTIDSKVPRSTCPCRSKKF